MKTELIVALDFAIRQDAEALVDEVGDAVTWYKIGKQMFTRYGPSAVEMLKQRQKRVFLDLKFHDIPNTVAKAVESALDIGADMVNVHASGGAAMMAAAAKSAKSANPDALLIAVTVLTSMDESALRGVGVPRQPAEQVEALARLAQDSGVQGVVASAHELELISRACGADFVTVIPGIRPAGAALGDQKRVMTPEQAAALGAHFIVVGRPITQAEDAARAARDIQASLR
jgi:orotidine-5'-phosphate decarboxylase